MTPALHVPVPIGFRVGQATASGQPILGDTGLLRVKPKPRQTLPDGALLVLIHYGEDGSNVDVHDTTPTPKVN
jgi:hypothetical protein